MDIKKLDKKWWKKEVGYQIYPRSFYDSNNDGIGDLNGITEKLDYLKELGITLIWICPVYKSPMDDNGYDISDYYDVNPEFGTKEDLERLISEAEKRGIKIILDLVINHTSDEHEWFIEALKNPESKYRNYYIFKRGKNGLPPTNWRSHFGGSAWEKVEGETDENGNEIFSNNIKREYLDKILDIDYKSFGKDIIITGYSGSNWFVTEDLREYFYNKKPDRTRYPKQITVEEFKKNDFTKIYFLGENHNELMELENAIMQAAGEENISILFASEGSLEIFSADCSKTKAAKAVLERDGLTLKDAVSFGDGLNDYDLITQTGLGFAMENSIYLLLEKLTDTEIIASNANDGMAKKVREIFDL